jgi:hypothetical protein
MSPYNAVHMHKLCWNLQHIEIKIYNIQSMINDIANFNIYIV